MQCTKLVTVRLLASTDRDEKESLPPAQQQPLTAFNGLKHGLRSRHQCHRPPAWWFPYTYICMLPPSLALLPLCSFSKHHTRSIHTTLSRRPSRPQGSLDLTEAKQWAVKWDAIRIELERSWKFGSSKFGFGKFGLHRCLAHFWLGPIHFRFSGFLVEFHEFFKVRFFLNLWEFIFVPSLIVEPYI